MIGGGFHQNILVKAGGELCVAVKQRGKAFQLCGSRQMAEEQQIAALGKAEAPLGNEVAAQIAHTVAAIVKLALNGGAFPLVNDVAVDIGDACHARHHARAVGLTQAALDAVVIKGRAWDLVFIFGFGDQLL